MACRWHSGSRRYCTHRTWGIYDHPSIGLTQTIESRIPRQGIFGSAQRNLFLAECFARSFLCHVCMLRDSRVWLSCIHKYTTLPDINYSFVYNSQIKAVTQRRNDWKKRKLLDRASLIVVSDVWINGSVIFGL